MATWDRRGPRVLEWSIFIAIVVHVALTSYHYGRMNERVDDLVRRCDRIERLLDPHPR